MTIEEIEAIKANQEEFGIQRVFPAGIDCMDPNEKVQFIWLSREDLDDSEDLENDN